MAPIRQFPKFCKFQSILNFGMRFSVSCMVTGTLTQNWMFDPRKIDPSGSVTPRNIHPKDRWPFGILTPWNIDPRNIHPPDRWPHDTEIWPHGILTHGIFIQRIGWPFGNLTRYTHGLYFTFICMLLYIQMLYVRYILYIDEVTYLDWPALFGFITQIFANLRQGRQNSDIPLAAITMYSYFYNSNEWTSLLCIYFECKN